MTEPNYCNSKASIIRAPKVGGGFISMIKGKGQGNRKTKEEDESKMAPITKAKRSETRMINNYEALAMISKKYYNSFAKHVENLITLDDLNGMTPALANTFRNVIVKYDMKGKDKIDRSNPLLLRNYLVTPETLPRNMRKEHLLQQVRYKLSQFNPKDALLFDSVDVTLDGKTATIIFRIINGDKYEKTNKVSDEYSLDMEQLQTDIKETITTIKKKMDYEIEVVDDFELGDEELKIPGIDFIDSDAGMEARLKALELGKEIDIDNADVDTLSEAEQKAENKEPVARDVIFDMESEEPPYRPRYGDNRNTAPDIGLDQGFGTDRQLEMIPLDIKQGLGDLFGEGDPENDDDRDRGRGQGMGARLGMRNNRPMRNTLRARERRFGSESGRRSRKNRNNRNNNNNDMGNNNRNNESLDPMERRCREISDPNQCRDTIGCYYNRKLNKCHKDVKL